MGGKYIEAGRIEREWRRRLRASSLYGTLAFSVLVTVIDLGSRALAETVAPYRIHTGDVVEVSIVGLPEMRMRSSVQPDGAVLFPLVGAVDVEGLTLPDLREALQRRFAYKAYPFRTNDGREATAIIKAEDVSAAIVEYRPVYVDGDVTRPGEVQFRPDMTVRQAIALAGGIDIGARSSVNPAIVAAEAKSDYESASIELAKAQARVARVRSELKGDDSIEASSDQHSGLADAELATIKQNEQKIMQARLTDYHREKEYLQTSIAQLGARLTVLERQQSEEEDGARADTEELKRTIDLLNKGNVTNPRVLDARRALLLSQTRALQVTDGVLQLKKQSTDLQRQLQHLDDDRRTELLKELQEDEAAVSMLKVKRDAAFEKLDLSATPRSRLSIDSEGSQTSVHVVRDDKSGSKTLPVKGDFRLEPGDVIDVAAKAQ